MEKYILFSKKKKKKKELENIFGTMEEFIQGFGKRINKMVQEGTPVHVIKKINLEFGFKVKERNGLMKNY